VIMLLFQSIALVCR